MKKQVRATVTHRRNYETDEGFEYYVSLEMENLQWNSKNPYSIEWLGIDGWDEHYDDNEDGYFLAMAAAKRMLVDFCDDGEFEAYDAIQVSYL